MTTTREYLEADGLGGFASATHGGMRQRRYHGVLLASTRPPTERFLLVAALDVEWRNGRERAALSTHEFEPGVLHPDGVRRMEAFTDDPWPQWTFRLPDGTTLTQELFVVRGAPLTFVRFRGANRGQLVVRPLLAGRDLHTLHHENSAIDLGAEPAPGGVRHTLYPGVPPIRVAANGTYRHAPDWYRQFRLRMEIERGFDGVEDLATPGEWTFDLARGPAVLAFGAEIASTPLPDLSDVTTAFRDAAAAEHVRRTAIDDPLARAATAYVVRRDEGDDRRRLPVVHRLGS